MSNYSTEVSFAGISFKNPITTASGTFGSGMEYGEFFDIDAFGAVTTKGVSAVPWEGNPTPRVAEVPGGMLNAIGLQNPGVDVFIKRDLAFLKEHDTGIIVNVCGHTLEEYLEVVEKLADQQVDMLEINISCPNVKNGALAFGTDPDMVFKVTDAIKKKAAQPVVMKLSPNVTSISEIAKAAESAGADGISLINTITGMKIDVERQSFVLANKTGGMSGAAIHPVAVRMVYEAAHAVDIPIIGMGGVMSAADAIELMLAGATMVAVGCATFTKPDIALDILGGIEDYMERHQIGDIKDIIGAVKE